MYLSQIQIKNFRQFDSEGLVVEFQPGVVALAGPNDSGMNFVFDIYQTGSNIYNINHTSFEAFTRKLMETKVVVF